jgi:hypothetical protein
LALLALRDLRELAFALRDLWGRASRFFVLRFAMVGGILLQEGQKIPMHEIGGCTSGATWGRQFALFLSQLAAGVEAIKIQDSVEHE